MKNCPSGDGALRGLTRLPADFRRLLPEIRWQSRLSPVSGTKSPDRFFDPVPRFAQREALRLAIVRKTVKQRAGP